MIKRALLSVSDKTGLVDFARGLQQLGVELLSTGGTAQSLREAGIPVKDVSEVTQFPEILDGRVKTLHPAIHAGILARATDADRSTLEAHGLQYIDLVVVNLYPFEKTIAQQGVTTAQGIEKIDVGGPTMIRAAAKNFNRVAVVADPGDYTEVLILLQKHGELDLPTRQRLARKAFERTAAYDAAIAAWFLTLEAPAEASQDFPPVLETKLALVQTLRYGENPHQRAAFYRDTTYTETNLTSARQLQGKELSYNNILDAEGALEMVRDFADLAPAAVVIVKHSNPCGIATGRTLQDAYVRARETDPNSAFGGIIALSTTCDAATARDIVQTFNEVVIAPAYSPEAVAILAEKKNMRVLETGPFTPKKQHPMFRGVVGGVLVTDRDLGLVTRDDLKVVSEIQPTPEDISGLLFAWRCVKWVKSNAIVYTDRNKTLGIGAGQMSRVDSARIGVSKAQSDGHNLTGCYMASDAFFPFRDNVDEAARVGVRAIIQPGGSIRDEEVIQAANEHSLVLVFTGMRHFRH
ncbi:MAG: bifunctional phosphoribosylaminoimidazolecarboxamide formyltransferase/IMP cyclohydrolase [Candidatus Sumerlaeia bacterium]|nr:bifunctional phosphoribosylaminoimidazolecarboxamide formyltransferase/IMP cyclohydrolase [Candidatus Sumerlaeia bacterium]